MEFNEFKFDPEEGFLNSDYYEDTPAEPREILQRQHNQTKDFINKMVDELNSFELSKKIKSPAIEGVAGEDVYTQLESIKGQLDNATTGVIPDGSVTSDKLGTKCVITEKLSDGSVTTEKFAEDAVCPKSVEVSKINGVSQSLYSPIDKCSPLSCFSERASDEIFERINGVTQSGKRYFINNNKLAILNLDSGAYEESYGTNISGNTIVAGDDGTGIIYINPDFTGSCAYVEIYKYDNETGNNELIKRLSIFNKGNNVSYLTSAKLYNNMLYFSGSVTYDNYLYSVDYNNCSELTSLAPFFYFYDRDMPVNFFMENGILYIGQRTVKISDYSTESELPGVVVDMDERLILEDCKDFPLLEKEKLLPAGCCLSEFNANNCFLYGGFLYYLCKNYLFRQRLY